MGCSLADASQSFHVESFQLSGQWSSAWRRRMLSEERKSRRPLVTSLSSAVLGSWVAGEGFANMSSLET